MVVLDEMDNVVYYTEVGDPEVLYGTDPDCYDNRELLTHTVTAKIPDEYMKNGYTIGYKLCNTIGQTARLDNALEYKNGINILCRIGE